MTSGHGRQTNDGEQHKSSRTFLELQRLKELRKQEKDRGKRTVLAKVHTQAEQEFKQWKKTLVREIESNSELVFDDSGQTWQFLLPMALTKLCYEVIIKEYMKARSLDRGGAIAQVRADLEGAAEVIEAKQTDGGDYLPQGSQRAKIG